jgi:protein-tyrosine phosphatase
MAEALLSAHLAIRGHPASVYSAGILGGGQPPPPEVLAVMAARGCDVTGHRSRRVALEDLAGADLVLGMAREHVRHAAVLMPDVWPRAFTLRELVSRGREAGARTPGEQVGEWLVRVASGRSRRGLLGSGTADDVADPVGGPPRGYKLTADLLDMLTGDLAALCWPTALSSSRGAGPMAKDAIVSGPPRATGERGDS